jgi:hypothetical protein
MPCGDVEELGGAHSDGLTRIPRSNPVEGNNLTPLGPPAPQAAPRARGEGF